MTRLVLLLCLIAAPVSAQSRFALPTANEQRAADIASWVTVATVTAFDAKASWDAPDRKKAFELQAARTAATYGVVFAAKLLVHRLRPCAPTCGSDNPRYSFFSAHTAVAFSTLGGPKLTISLPLATATGGLRLAANKHWLTDVLVGAGVGAALSRMR